MNHWEMSHKAHKGLKMVQVVQEPVKDPARLERHEVTKVAQYWVEVNSMARPMQGRECQAE